ncbi:carbohydrate sulfotransferase 15-like [Lytechinus pictus]|uniref:carbohydrate sulfotransferase 15-like n=1 Tax=Lytechinus pictus TaxID=7653 RepID=UPI0030B9C913
MAWFSKRIIFFLFIVVSTILFIILQFTNISDLISSSSVQKQSTSEHYGNRPINIHEIQENAERGRGEGINKEHTKTNKKKREKNNGMGSKANLRPNWNGNASSIFPPNNEPKYNIVLRKASEPYYPNVFQYDEEGNILYLKKNEMTTMRPGATKELVLSAPELFDKIPTRFLDNFKNPCWLREGNELNCLPYFYIIGMYKCATSDIWDKIVQHPDISKAAKEPHWWGPRRHGYTVSRVFRQVVLRSRNVTGGVDDSSLEWYLNIYKFDVIRRLLEGKEKRGNQYYYPMVYGDASISTASAMGLEWIEQYPNDKEPPYTNADLIRALQPNAKIILMVRNPTQRAISWWWYSHRSHIHSLKSPYSAKTLHEQIVKYIECFNDCLKEHNLRYCAYAAGCPYELIPNIQVGIYHVYLQDWIRAFSRDSVLVIRVEDWHTNQAELYRKVMEFLDLRQLTQSQFGEIMDRETKHITEKNHEDAWPETVSLLDSFFHPYNKELAKLMGDDKFLYL